MPFLKPFKFGKTWDFNPLFWLQVC